MAVEKPDTDWQRFRKAYKKAMDNRPEEQKHDDRTRDVAGLLLLGTGVLLVVFTVLVILAL